MESGSLSADKKVMAKGTAWNLAGSVALKAVSLVYTILLARLFPPEEVGIFYLALGAMYIAAIFSDLGLNASFRRYFPFFLGKGDKRAAHNLFFSSYIFTGGLSILVAAALFLLSWPIADFYGAPALAPVLQFLSLFLATSTYFGLNTAFLTGLKKYREVNIINNGQNILKLLLTVALFFYFGQDAIAMAVAFTASYFVFVIVSFWFVKKELGRNGLGGHGFDLRGKISMLREVVPFGLALALVAEINNIAFYTDRMMMGYLIDPGQAIAQIGVYSIALSLALFVPLFPGAISGIFSPIITGMYGKGDKEGMGRMAKTAVRWNIFLLAPITTVMIIFAEDIMQMLYGAAYAGGAFVLAVFSAGVFLRQLATVQGTVLEAMRMVRVEFYVAITSVVLNLALNWLLIPEYGMDGAAVASSVSLVAAMVLIMAFCRKITGLEFSRESARPLAAGIIAFGIILLLRGQVVEAMQAIPAGMFSEDALAAAIYQKFVKMLVLACILAFNFAIYFVCAVGMRGLEKEDWELAFLAMGKARVPGGAIERMRGIVKRFY